MTSTADAWIALIPLCNRYSRRFDTRGYDLVLSCFVAGSATSYDCSSLDVPMDVLRYDSPRTWSPTCGASTRHCAGCSTATATTTS